MSKQYIFKIKDHHDNVYDKQVRRDIIQGRPLPSLENPSSSGCRKSRYVTVVTISIIKIQTLMTKCHSICHQTPKFPTPPKSYATIFFWVTQDPILVQLILIIQKITKKSLLGHFLGYPPQNALQCTTVQCNGLKCKRLNYSIQMGQI